MGIDPTAVSAWTEIGGVELMRVKREKDDGYWAVQAGLLTPLTFAQHRLSPLAAFTSGAYFFHNGRR